MGVVSSDRALNLYIQETIYTSLEPIPQSTGGFYNSLAV